MSKLEELNINHDKDWHAVYIGNYNGMMTAHIDDMEIFCVHQLEGRWHRYLFRFWFELESDAVMFTLKWK